MKPRAEATKSAPTQSAQATWPGLISLPEATTLTLGRRPWASRASTTSGRLSWIGRPTKSIRLAGAAPVPPSALSTVMKSGAEATPRATISRQKSSIQVSSPITVLIPVGLPVTRRTRATRSSRSPTSSVSRCRFGLTESRPAGMPRIAAISSVTLAAGRMPPLPGLAPWLSLISNIRTWSSAAIRARRPSSSTPTSPQTPYLAVPIWKTMSAPPCRCHSVRPPSPVFSQQPARAAPLDRARTAGLEMAPKLIAETLKKLAVV